MLARSLSEAMVVVLWLTTLTVSDDIMMCIISYLFIYFWAYFLCGDGVTFW